LPLRLSVERFAEFHDIDAMLTESGAHWW
jgi:hypothetical protein